MPPKNAPVRARTTVVVLQQVVARIKCHLVVLLALENVPHPTVSIRAKAIAAVPEATVAVLQEKTAAITGKSPHEPSLVVILETVPGKRRRLLWSLVLPLASSMVQMVVVLVLSLRTSLRPT